MENWQSEYLQFMLFMLATIWLIQRGSPESKEPEQARAASPSRSRGSARTRKTTRPTWAQDRRRQDRDLLELAADRDVDHLLRLLVRPVGDRLDGVQRRAGRPPRDASVSWLGYLGSAPTSGRPPCENWQSEFLAVGSFAALTVYLRQRGSPESKPVGRPARRHRRRGLRASEEASSDGRGSSARSAAALRAAPPAGRGGCSAGHRRGSARVTRAPIRLRSLVRRRRRRPRRAPRSAGPGPGGPPRART